MIDVIAIVEGRRHTIDSARSALADAPVQPERERPTLTERLERPRLGFSQTLRRLADRVEPAPRCRPVILTRR